MFDEPRAPRKLDGGIPAELETIVLKCLEKSPADRYATAKDLAEDPGRFAADVPIVARPIGRAERAWRWCRRNPVVAGSIAAVAVVLTAWALTATVMAVRLKDARDASDGAARNAKLAAEDAREKEAIAVSKSEEAEKLNESLKNAYKEILKLLAQLEQLGVSPKGQQLVESKIEELAKKLVAEHVSDFALVGYWSAKADSLLKRGGNAEALDLLKRAYQYLQEISANNPESDLARANIGVIAHQIGKVCLDNLDDPREARRYLIEGRDLQQEIADHPRSTDYDANANDRILSIHQVRSLLPLRRASDRRPRPGARKSRRVEPCATGRRASAR